MSTTDIVIPAASLALILIEVIFDKGHSAKKYGLIVIGIFTFGFSLWASIQSSDDIKELKDNGIVLIEGRHYDSVSNAAFVKYVKDSFGIERVGDKAQLVNNYSTTTNTNTTNYNQPLELKKDEPKITDETNYTYKVVGTKLYIAPKEGVWLNPYFQFESRLMAQNKNITIDNEIPIDEGNSISDEVNIGNGKYRVYTVSQFKRPIIYNNPLVLDLSSDPNQFIIFGEQGIPTKSYLYQRGKVSWFPLNRP